MSWFTLMISLLSTPLFFPALKFSLSTVFTTPDELPFNIVLPPLQMATSLPELGAAGVGLTLNIVVLKPVA